MVAITEEATSKYVRAGKVRIHYHEVGAGHPLICLHGAGPGASSCQDLAQKPQGLPVREQW